MFLIDFIINILVIMFTILESFVERRSLMQQKRPFMEESKLILVHTLYPDTLVGSTPTSLTLKALDT